MTDYLDDQPFYELMQQYRHAPLTNPQEVVSAFEAVKEFVRAHQAELHHKLAHQESVFDAWKEISK